MNYLKLSILVSFLFLVGCSDSQEEPEVTTEEEQGPPFSEYMTCTPGSDFNDETARMMVDEWNDFKKNVEQDHALYDAAGLGAGPGPEPVAAKEEPVDSDQQPAPGWFCQFCVRPSGSGRASCPIALSYSSIV